MSTVRAKSGGQLVVQPVVVREPGAALRHRDQIARARVIDAVALLLAPVEDLRHTLEVAQDAFCVLARVLRARVDVRDLVVGDGQGGAGERVEHLADGRGPNLQQALAAQHAVDVDRSIDVLEAVLADDDELEAAALGRAPQLAEHLVDLAQGRARARVARTVALVVPNHWDLADTRPTTVT